MEYIISFISVFSSMHNSLYSWAKNSIFYYQFLLSIISAIIFWFIFSRFPEQKKYKSLRPIVELDMYHIYSALFHLFDLIMSNKYPCPSFYQEKIRGERLSRSDIKLGLQNKCLNESYLFDPKINTLLMPIGDQIFESSKKIEELIDKIFGFNQFSSPQELLLLEKIRQELKKYDFGEQEVKRNAVSIMGTQQLYPSVPVIYYREENFYGLYELFIELQDIVLNKNKYSNRDIFILRIQYLYYSSQYKQCINHIERHRSLFPDEMNFCQDYYALCEYALGNKNKFYEIVENMYKDRPHNGGLVYSRNFLKDFIEDEKLVNILRKYHTDEEYKIFKATIEKEKEYFDLFINTNKSLSKYYVEKDFRLKPIEDEEEN